MELLLVRHAIAEERDEFAKAGKSDFHRPLSGLGTKKFTQGARGLKLVFPKPDVILSSPLTRAMQTAELIEQALKDVAIQKVECLGPDQEPVELLGLLEENSGKWKRVIVVGHEPHLSKFISYGLSFAETPFLKMTKGGAVLLSHEEKGSFYEGKFLLEWALQANQLRTLGQLKETIE